MVQLLGTAKWLRNCGEGSTEARLKEVSVWEPII
jgi:hypothetical protein